MKIFIASDHAGKELKDALIPLLSSKGYEVEDCTSVNEPDDDYPDAVRPCTEKVVTTSDSFGIVIGASGQGEAMAANRVPGIRAAVFYGPASRVQTDATGHAYDLIASVREHNNANILSLGARFISLEEAQDAVLTFLQTPFSSEERHIRRVKKLG